MRINQIKVYLFILPKNYNKILRTCCFIRASNLFKPRRRRIHAVRRMKGDIPRRGGREGREGEVDGSIKGRK
jgi:hypothetical protein